MRRASESSGRLQPRGQPFVAEATPGYLDTNVVIHAFATDAHSDECSSHLRALRDGRVRAIVDPLVIHELTYVLPQFVKQMSRIDVGSFLLDLIGWESIQADKAVLVGAIERWRDNPSLGFVDAYLGTLAVRKDAPVFTKNVGDFAKFGATVPDPLPV